MLPPILSLKKTVSREFLPLVFFHQKAFWVALMALKADFVFGRIFMKLSKEMQSKKLKVIERNTVGIAQYLSYTTESRLGGISYTVECRLGGVCYTAESHK